jgi:hypothetical protein
MVVVTLDVGVSLAQPLRLGEVALLWRDALVFTSAVLPKALSAALPSDVDVVDAEIHAAAQRIDGKVGTRSNDLLARVNLTPLGALSGPGPAPESMSYAARLAGPLTEYSAAELVADAIDIMAYDLGYTDPRIGLRTIRGELGLSNN